MVLDIRGLARLARKQGWHIDRAKKHIRFTDPNGRVLTFPLTPSDARSIKNTTADLRRAGLHVPRKGERHHR